MTPRDPQVGRLPTLPRVDVTRASCGLDQGFVRGLRPHVSPTTVDLFQASVVLILPGLVTALVQTLPGSVNRCGCLSPTRLKQGIRHQALTTL